MTRLEATLRLVADSLTEADAAFALVGGLAVSIRSEPRFTRDVDLAVAVPDDHVAERLILKLHQDEFVPIASVEHDTQDRLATVRLAAPGEGASSVVVDLLFASSGIEEEIVASAELIEVVPGLALPVATTGHLIALKILSRDDIRRPQDSGDLRHLLRLATESEKEEASHAVERIMALGYHRGRNLMEDFERALAEFTPSR